VTDIAIQVEGLSKYYRIGKRGVQLTLKDSLAKSWRRAFNLFKFQNNRQDEFRDTNNSIWALSDVSFEVKKGEIIGIIGRNGAGKTTLLKILSRITEPTKGYAEINGRVGSLLEVGTGFHPELTGRENIYLNGAILGMKRAEIDHKFDNIVAFSEIEKFLDTPVKRYSSGMYVRLAFAVAAHLEPEVLMVDEVLAVGDTAFQRKCVGKMGDVAKEGRTVLFVSHNMSSISALCSRGIWIDNGKIVQEGPPDHVIQAYLSDGISGKSTIRFTTNAAKTGQISFISIEAEGEKPSTVLPFGKPIFIKIGYLIRERLVDHRVGVVIRNMAGVTIFVSNNSDFFTKSMSITPGTYVTRLKIPGSLLNAGIYVVSCYLGEPKVRRLDTRDNAIHFEITGNPYRSNEVRQGLLAYPFEWHLEKTDSWSQNIRGSQVKRK